MNKYNLLIFLLQHLGVEKELVPLLSVSELSRPEPELLVAGELVRKVLLLMTDIRCVCRMIKVDRQKHMKPLKGNYLLCVCDQSVVQAKRKYWRLPAICVHRHLSHLYQAIKNTFYCKCVLTQARVRSKSGGVLARRNMILSTARMSISFDTALSSVVAKH